MRRCAGVYSVSEKVTSMMGRFLSVCGLALVLALPGSASAGELRLAIQNGRVALYARDVTLRQILLEWERVGGTRIVMPDRVPDALLTLELVNVPEGQALETLLRSTSGYVAAKRLESVSGASGYRLIVIMPGAASPVVASLTSEGGQRSGTALPAGSGRPQIERRIMPDGRVVAFQENPRRPDDISVAEDEQAAQAITGDSPMMMVPPGQLAPGQFPQNLQQGLPPGLSRGPLQGQNSTGASSADRSGVQGSGNQPPQGLRTAPTAVKSSPRPGMVIPEPPAPYIPGGGIAPPPPPPPPVIKPPGL